MRKLIPWVCVAFVLCGCGGGSNYVAPQAVGYTQGGILIVNDWANYWAQAASYTFTFKQPLVAPCTIMVASADQLNYGTIKDSQGNSFEVATGQSDLRLLYSNSCASGTDTITVTCPNNLPCWEEVIFAVYAGALTPVQVSPETFNVVSEYGWSAPVLAEAGELVIGIGSNHTTGLPGIIGDGGFTLRDHANAFIEDMVATASGEVTSKVTYSSPVNWCQFTMSFKPR
jgi:hypothetical protein